jgi:hypothetical protein
MVIIRVMSDILLQMAHLFKLSAGPFLSLWAIRYNADWDYKLSPSAKSLRWSMVLLGYFLGCSLPGRSLAWVRLLAGLTGLCFLCWPNFAYHLDRLLREWPTAEGTIVSSHEEERGRSISYNFNFSGQRYGGIAYLMETGDRVLADGTTVLVRYDPYNPDNSKLDLR